MVFAPLVPGGLFSTHWSVVLVVGLLFFCVQVVLSARISLTLRRQERLLQRLCDELRRGGDGRPTAKSLPDGAAWLKWVVTIFPAGGAASSYTRDSVLQELDARLASNSSYLLLQRMGVMAPLLGVILTVAGFWYLRVEESGDIQLQDILFAVTPLVSGVGAGAVLALVNQVLLHWISQRLESVRMVARTWFDLAIWTLVGLDSQATIGNAIGAIERMAVALSEAANHSTESADRLTVATSTINDSSRDFCGMVRGLGGQLQGIPQTIGDLTSAIQASSMALEGLIHVGSRAVANLDVSVAAFRTTVDSDFAIIARQQRASAESLAATAQDIAVLTESLSARDLQDAIVSAFRSAVEHQIAPGAARHNRQFGVFSETVEKLRKSASNLCYSTAATKSVSQQQENYADTVSRTQHNLADLVESLAAVAAQLQAMVDKEVDPANRILEDAATITAKSAAQHSLDTNGDFGELVGQSN